MKALFLTTLAAAQTSLADQAKGISKQTWINLLICVVALIVVVKVWKSLKKLNDFLPYIAAAVAGFLIFFYWIYERSEPKFLTPVIEKIAPFFPNKSTFEPTKR